MKRNEKHNEAVEERNDKSNLTFAGRDFDKSALSDFLSEYMRTGELVGDFNNLRPDQRIQAMVRLAGYVLPKLKAVDVDLTDGTEFNPESPFLGEI
ncbi:MAG: hypothetical protein NC186_05815 [Prevotella sp.]|nr:hypothetical protein [Prevotella sp.]